MAGDSPSEEIFRGKLITLRVETVPRPGGGTSRFEIVEHPGGVAIVALRDAPAGGSAAPEVVLVSQQRPAIDKLLWELPAGLVEAEERDRPQLAAARELLEETGYIAERWQLLTRVYLSPGFSTETSTLYLARQARPALDASGAVLPADPTEIDQVHWLSLHEALAWCQTGMIEDGKTMLGLYLTQHLFAQGAL